MTHYKTICMNGNYVDGRLEGDLFSNETIWKNLYSIFKDGVDEYNLLFYTPDAVHSVGFDLDTIEQYWNVEYEIDKNYHGRTFTYLIFHPRLICIKYGVLEIRSKEDIRWLRMMIHNSLYVMNKTQRGNTK